MPQFMGSSKLQNRSASKSITVPVSVQKALGVIPGDVIGYYLDDGKVIIKKNRLNYFAPLMLIPTDAFIIISNLLVSGG